MSSIMVHIFSTLNIDHEYAQFVRHSEHNIHVWYKDLVKLWYGPPLQAPMPTMQTTIAAINI